VTCTNSKIFCVYGLFQIHAWPTRAQKQIKARLDFGAWSALGFSSS